MAEEFQTSAQPVPYFQETVQQPTQLDFAPKDEPPSNKLHFEPDPSPVFNLSEGVAAQRAGKAYEGVKRIIPVDYQDLKDKFQQGLEQPQRERDARAVDAYNSNRRNAAIMQLANQKKGPVTQEELAEIDRQLFRGDLYDGVTDPRSIYEEKYARAYLSYVNWPISKEDNHWLQQARNEIPQYVMQAEDDASNWIKQNEYIDHRLQNVQEKLEQRGIAGSVGSFAAGAVPFLTQYMLRNNVPFPGFDFTTSGSLEDQRIALTRLPFNQFKDEFDKIMDNLESYNLDYAHSFASAMKGQSTQEQNQHMFGDVIDITTIPAIKVGTSLVRRAVLYNSVRRAYADMAESATRPATGTATTPAAPAPRVPEVQAANAAGNMERAAVTQEGINAAGRMAGRDNPSNGILSNLASIFTGHRDQVGAGPGAYGREIVNRIQENYDSFANNFLQVMQNIMRVERIPAVLASRRAVAEILDGIRSEYRNLGNSIINQSEIYWNQVANTYYSDLVLGQVDGTMFRSEGQARVFATQARLEGYTLETSGAGTVIRMPKPIKENTTWLRDALLTAETRVPDSMLQNYTSWLGWARTPDETLAAQNVWNRKTAAYASSILKNLYKRNAKNILELTEGRVLKGTKFSRERMQQAREWQQMIDAQRNENDANGLRGRWFNNPADIEHYYWANFGRAPSQLEIAAYFDFKRTVMFDYALRNLEVYKYMSRVGTEEWRVSAFRNASNRGYSQWIRGVKQIDMPPEDAIVLHMGRNIGDERIFRGRMPATTRADLRNRIQSGELQLIRLWEPGHQPMAGWSSRIRPNDRIEYIISDSMHNRPLPYQVLPMREGGHVEYDFKHYIKQARIIPQNTGRRGGVRTFQHWYQGDTTVMAVQHLALGEDGARILNEAREHLQAGRNVEAEFALSRLPIDFREFQSWFRPSVSPTGVRHPARLSLNQAFHAVPENRMIGDVVDLESQFRDTATGRSTFRDGTKGGSLSSQYHVPFTQPRDAYELMGLRDEGSRYRPLYRVEPATMVNPLTTMNRGMNRIINAFFLDDYKLMSVEHWLQQAYPYMDVEGGLNAVRNSPFYFFHRADNFWRRNPDRAFQAQVTKLQVAAKEIKILMGEQSWFDQQYQSIMNRIASDIYGTRNPFIKLGLRMTHWGLPTIVKAGDYARAAVFHSTIGLFNHVQALVQNLTYINILALSPLNGLKGVLGATLHQFARLAGIARLDVIDLFDRIASKMGYRPGEFREAHNLLARTGFEHVGGEHILAHYNFEPNIFRSSFGKFLDFGQAFFKGGERHMRYGAWYTAYHDFRAKNPTGPITNENLREILNRADLLSGNMTTTSKSMLQRGIGNFSTQFLGYQLRLAELMMGKRIDRLAKTRLYMANAIMYGIPAGLGIAGMPWGESLREQAPKHGYVIGDSWWQDVAMNGLPAYIGAMIDGHGDPQAGTQLNVGDRYGSPGLDFLREALYGDKTFIDLMTGATGQTIAHYYTHIDGFAKVIYSLAHDGGESFPLTSDAVWDAAREIAEINNWSKYAGAVNSGSWSTKSGQMLDDVSPTEAMVRLLTGLQSQQASDVIRKQHDFAEDQKAQKEAVKLFTIEFQRAVHAVHDHDHSSADAHFKRATAYLAAVNYPRNLYDRAIKSALDGVDRGLIQREDYNYYLRNVPAGEEENRNQYYQNILKLEGQRGQH